MPLSTQLARAREATGYSQEQAAAALGVNRAMVSYWESGSRVPNDRQLVALARIYRVTAGQLQSDEELYPRLDLANMMFRSEAGIPESARPGIQDFISFLDTYAKLASETGTRIHGLAASPFINRSEFTSGEDVRRKAEAVRSHLRLGIGPISDIDWVCEMLGVTVFRAELGSDLKTVPSGVFVKHQDVGFSVLVNLSMTPGRRRFTIAHELAHALFHSDEKHAYVVSLPTQSPHEKFADAFAGEFLMPAEGIRGFMEENGMGRTIVDPSEVIHLQRYFKVSFPTALLRLRQLRILSSHLFNDYKRIRPVLLARSLGYEVDGEEIVQNPDTWRVIRFPRRFIQMLRNAIMHDVLSVSTASSITGLTIDEVAALLEIQSESTTDPLIGREIAEYEDSLAV